MRLAVVGHIEWVEFLRVEKLPASGEIAHGSGFFAEPAGGGAVAAVQLARLGGETELFTALGDDEVAKRSRARLEELGVSVHAATRDGPTRRAITQVDPAGERTITTVGERLAPRGDDPLPWERLDGADGAYFTAGDAGALARAREARVLVATPRAGDVLDEAGVELDALVYSERDPTGRAASLSLSSRARLTVATRGSEGGAYTTPKGKRGHWEPAEPPGPVADTYGSGDSFAAALTWALADGRDPAAAVELGARAGAAAATGRGPYERQLGEADLGGSG